MKAKVTTDERGETLSDSVVLADLMPSGVTSKTQLRMRAIGNPIASRTITKVSAHGGRFSGSSTVVMTSMSHQAATAYIAATWNTFRCLISRRKDILAPHPLLLRFYINREPEG